MMNRIFRPVLILICTLALGAELFAAEGDDGINFTAIGHASFVINTASAVIFVDPVSAAGSMRLPGSNKPLIPEETQMKKARASGKAAGSGSLPLKYKGVPQPDIILVTHAHFDHFDKKLIGQLKKKNTLVLGPRAVIAELNYGEVINNGENKKVGDVLIEAVPAYNTTPDRMSYHPKGDGNGYVVTISGKRIYISGDTEDIPEMRHLNNIDYAFVCMNLPYTMSAEQAASAVLEFKPKVLFPYHYREEDASNINVFYELVSKDKDIRIKFLHWYD